MPKKTSLQKKKKADDLRYYGITMVILFVVLVSGWLGDGILVTTVIGLARWLLGDVYVVIVVLCMLWAALNAWHVYRDEKKESAWPLVFTVVSLLMCMTFIDADKKGFEFLTNIFMQFGDFFRDPVPVRAGGGVLGGVVYGLVSFALGKNMVIVIVVILMTAAATMLVRSDTFSPGFRNVTETTAAFFRKPEKEEPEEPEIPEEPKPVRNLWVMLDEHKEKKKERESKIGKISVSEEIPEEPDVSLMEEVKRENESAQKYRKMINISADGPTEEIMLVSIPGKTVSSRKNIFITVDDLQEDPEDVRSYKDKTVPQENVSDDYIEPEPTYGYEEAESLPPVQQTLPLEMSVPVVEPAVKETAGEAAGRMTRRKASHSRKSEAEKPYRKPNAYQLLDPVPAKNRNGANEIDAREKGELLVQILRNFEIESRLIDTHIGPAVTQFEIRPDANVKISRINSLTDNIKMQLAARELRIEAPIPGRNAIGIEIPNAETTPVKMREMLGDISEKDKNAALLFFLGKDLLGRTVTCRLDKMPHLLIAGATGSGKSVCMNAIITSLLLRTDPDKVKMLLIDPKKVEFTPYHNIPHLIGPVINDANQANNALKIIVQKMDERYNMFAACGVRNIEGYNAKVLAQNGRPNDDGSPAPKYMPYIVVIIDELADLMIVAGKDVEGSIQRITQLARAAGIHLIVATQRPSVNVITGVIKANIPSRIAFSVSSAIDSRTILDSHGAERLLGNGDMLYLPMGTNSPVRVQGVFVTDDEVARITEAVSAQKKPFYDDAFILLEGVEGNEGSAMMSVTDDPMFEEVKDYVVEAQKASTSLLQRRFGIGYNRAARMIDALEEKGVIGPAQGSKPRDVYLKPETKKNMTETGGTY